MTSTTPSPTRGRPRDAGGRRLGPLATTILVIAVVVALTLVAAQVVTEYWWFDEAGYSRVLLTEWGTKLVLFLVGALFMGAALWGNVVLAHRKRPVYVDKAARVGPMDQYRNAFEPLRRLATIAVPLIIGLFAGLAMASRWQEIQLWLHGQSFAETDPQFHLDLSFYVFTLPALQFLLSFVTVTAVLALILTAFISYLYGGFQIRQLPHARPTVAVTYAARMHLSILGAVVMVLVAAHFWLSRYATLMSATGVAQGADYTAVHAGIPARTILAGVALVVAALFVAVGVRGNWRLPALGLGLMVITGLLIGVAYPTIVARFQVQPNAQELEAPFIQRNIDATRTAFGLNDIDVRDYAATTTAEAGALREDAETTASIRLLDPNVVSPAFRQLQQNKQYYNFAETLAVDKYTFGDTSHDTVIGVRELNIAGLGEDQRNWVNEHTVFTHGYGVVAAYGNQVTSDGRPAFFESDIPSVGKLSDSSASESYEARIYFSPNAPQYSIVGSQSGTEPWELDYPDDSAAGQVKTTFPTTTTSAGPKLDNFASRLLYSLKFQSEQILFSDRVNSDSQIVYDRNPAQRVSKVAPYLTLDGRVYPAVVDGRVVWIVDGYTTSGNYPYATRQALDSATQDSLTQSSSSVDALEADQVNYLRNSVKATVDAFDGTVTLYAWDDTDPVLKTWQQVFPSTVKPLSEMSAALISHIRYPEDLFKVQRTVLAKYHVTDAAAFFTAQDFWQVPKDPTASVGGTTAAVQPPYYVTLQMPGQDASSFSLTSTFIPGGNSDRQILTGFLAADADAGNVAGVKSAGYGKLRLLVLPRNATVPGPGQVQTKFNTDSAVAQAFTYIKQGNSTIVQGNLLTLPVGGGLLYVQPVYAVSSQGSKYPLLRYVMVAFGDKVGFATTLSEALDQVFEGDSGAETSGNDGATDADAGGTGTGTGSGTGTETPATPTPTPTPTATPTAPATPDSGTDAQARLTAALTDMQEAVTQGDTALKAGDFAAYGKAQTALQDALDRALAAEKDVNAAKK